MSLFHRPKSSFWRFVVKDVRQTKQHPGYEYVMFTSFDDFNAYMLETTGNAEWYNEPWARYLMRQDWSKQMAAIRKKMRDNKQQAEHNAPVVYVEKREEVAEDKPKPRKHAYPLAVIFAAYDMCREAQPDATLTTIVERMQQEHDIQVSYEVIRRLLKKNGKWGRGTNGKKE